MITQNYITAENPAERNILESAIRFEIGNWFDWRPAHSSASLTDKAESRGEYRIDNVKLLDDGYRFEVRLQVRRPRQDNDPKPLFGTFADEYTKWTECFTVALTSADHHGLRITLLEHTDGEYLREDADILTDLSSNIMIKQNYL